MNSRELRAERAKLHTRMRELVDRAEVENRNLSAEESVEFERLHGEQNALSERISRTEMLESTPLSSAPASAPVAGLSIVQPSQVDEEVRRAEHRRVFNLALRFGVNRLKPEDQAILAPYVGDLADGKFENALQTTQGSGGGYLITPDGFREGIVEAMKAWGGMRRLSTVFTTSDGADLPFATSDDTGNVGELLAEGQTTTELSPSFGVRIMRAYVFSSKVVRVSVQLLNDSAFDLEAFLTKAFGVRIGRATNAYFTTGNGGAEPSGILTDATLGKAAASATAIAWDELMELEHSVDPAYRTGPATAYMFHDQTLLVLKKLKNGEGEYLWQPGVQMGEPDRLNGFPYVINQDMPQIATTAKSVLFGDLSMYYIRDVDEVAVLRLAELYALQRQVAFVAFSRHDGALIDAGTHPVKYLQQA